MERTRVLVTGFEPFPGAPVNPTERLVRHFLQQPPRAETEVDWRFAVLPVHYLESVPALEAAVGDFNPDIAVHFGLAREAVGFRLETTARNAVTSSVPDNAGHRPDNRPIVAGAGDHASTLPLQAIARALDEGGFPVSWSDDAGGYLCNYVFYHAAGGLCPGLPAAMTGFVHVPPLPGEGVDTGAMIFEDLVNGAEIVLRTCVEAHRRR